MVIRFLVTFAILLPFFLIEPGFNRPMWQTFAIAMLAFGTGRLVEWAVHGRKQPPSGGPGREP